MDEAKDYLSEDPGQILWRSRATTYMWWSDDLSDIRPEHTAELEAYANAHIAESMAKGLSSGNLEHVIRVDGEAIASAYAGWWEGTTPQPGMFYVSGCPDTGQIFVCEGGIDNNICEVFVRNDTENACKNATRIARALNTLYQGHP